MRGRTLLGRTTPVSDRYGRDRGTPVDRVFIHEFLHRHRADVRGRVLELEPAEYTHTIGSDRVVSSTVLSAQTSPTGDVMCADLAEPGAVPLASFDCFIFTQTLQYIADPFTACRNAWDCLVDGGVLLATVPVISRMDTGSRWPEYWRFTPLGLEHLLREAGPWAELVVEGRGNVLTGAAFLYGLSAEEIDPGALAEHDEKFPVLVCARAVKPGAQP